MAYTTVYQGIVFVEGDHPTARTGASAEVDLSFVVGAQLKSLRDVKNYLVAQTKQNGCNAIVGFTYGQKSRWLAIDDIAFWGKGVLATIDEPEYTALCKAAAHGA